MQRLTIVGLLMLLSLLVSPATLAAEETYQLKVATGRPNAIYETGERAKFLITLTKEDQPVTEGTVNYVVDDFIADHGDFPRGQLELGQPLEIEVRSQKPGFLRCHVTFRSPENKVFRATAGAAFSPTKIGLSLPVPDDFDAFWAAQKAQLAELPADAELTHVEYNDPSVDCFDVQVACIGGAPVSGYFAKPSKVEEKSLPAILWVHGAGVRSSSLSNAVKGARAGMLSFDINAHGIPNGRPDGFYKKLSAEHLSNYRHAGREDRDTIYFRGMFLRLGPRDRLPHRSTGMGRKEDGGDRA